jgi:hypothetical protein
VGVGSGRESRELICTLKAHVLYASFNSTGVARLPVGSRRGGHGGGWAPVRRGLAGGRPGGCAGVVLLVIAGGRFATAAARAFARRAPRTAPQRRMRKALAGARGRAQRAGARSAPARVLSK